MSNSLFNKINNNRNGNQKQFSFNNNTNSNNSPFQGQQSNGFDNTDRAPGYMPMYHQVPPPIQQQVVTPQPQATTQTVPPSNQPTTPPKQSGFSFGQQVTTTQPQNPNLPVGYQQEYLTYQYPTKGEIWSDLALRVFEVVVGAAAIAAGQEVARFFTRRRFEPKVPFHHSYQQPTQQPQKFGQTVNTYQQPQNINTWRK